MKNIFIESTVNIKNMKGKKNLYTTYFIKDDLYT